MSKTIVFTPESIGFEEVKLLSKPEPLPGLPAVQPFEIELLPKALRAYALDVTERMQCPVDFVGVGLMASLSAVVGRRRSIYAKLFDNWSVVPNLWCAFIGNPAAMKSPALAAVTLALKRIDRQMAAEFELANKNHEVEASINEFLKQESKSKAKIATNSGDADSARKLLFELIDKKPNLPKQTRLIETDTTVEALQISMEASPNGLLILRDELGGWIKRLENEDQAETRSFYLLSASGKESHSVRRVGRGTLFIENCVLSIIGGIQPAFISKITKAALSGESNDGLIQRFQLAVWPDDTSSYKFIDRAPDFDAEKQYHNLFDTLHALEHNSNPLRMTEAAAKLFEDWHTKLHLQIRSNEFHTAIQSHLIKSSETVLSIALLCELAENPLATQVGLQSISRALDWSDYLRSHVQRLYHLGNDAAVVAAKVILSKRKHIPERFTARDIARKCWSGVYPDIVSSAIEVLINYGHLNDMFFDSGGRPTTIYTWVK